MKSAFPAAALVLLVGIAIPASARGQGGPPQAARPAQQQARPVQQQRQDRPAAREPAQIARRRANSQGTPSWSSIPARRTV
jgi:hypothetical protein